MSIKWRIAVYFVGREIKKILARILNALSRIKTGSKPKPPEEFKIDEKIKEVGP